MTIPSKLEELREEERRSQKRRESGVQKRRGKVEEEEDVVRSQEPSCPNLVSCDQSSRGKRAVGNKIAETGAEKTNVRR
jgi:hypothetical protein